MKIPQVKYPNINSKLKGMYAKRITRADLEDVIKQNQLKNVFILLKSKNEIFKDVDENIDRLEIESLLDQSQIKDIQKILKLLNNKDKKLFELFLLQYEIKCIKSIFRKLFTNDKTADVIMQNVKNWTLELFEDIKGIETVQTFDEFFLAIKRMKYNEILKKYQEQENINIFEVENEIDKLYFETLFDKIKQNANLKKIVGSEIDLLNILWIFRVKKYYKFEKEKLKQIVINKNYKLKSSTINKLIQANSFDELKQIIENTPYKEIFTQENDIEENIDKYLYSINKKIFKEDIMSIAFIFAYVNLIDYENNDIINTIEGIRYNMEKREILKRLVI